MFAWSPTKILGVSQEVIDHTLNIKPRSKPIKHGLRRFSLEKRQAMGEDLSRLFGPCAKKASDHG
jgi:hypothetical protein